MDARRTVVRVGAAVAILFAAVASLGAPGGAQQPATGQVVVVHGLRGLVADVYVDGKKVLKAFEPERVTDPLTLPVGAHVVDVRETGAAAGAKPLLHATILVAAGVRLSAVVHQGVAKDAELTVFRDNVNPISAGQSRLVVRDTAAAPAFAVLLDGKTVTQVKPKDQSEADVQADKYQLSLLAGGKPLAKPQDVPLDEGTVNFLYLIGSASNNSLGWLANKVAGAAQPPAAVQTGNSGLAEQGRSFPWPAVGALGTVALAAGWVLRRTGAPGTARRTDRTAGS